MNEKLLTRMTQAAQIMGIQNSNKYADLLREARSEILRLQVRSLLYENALTDAIEIIQDVDAHSVHEMHPGYKAIADLIN